MLELLLLKLRELQELRELQGLRELQELRVLHFVSLGDVLDMGVGPLVEVGTGLNMRASNGRWKSCLSCLRAAM